MLCILMFLVFIGKAQTPSPHDLTLFTPQTIPADETKRATTWLKLTDGFKYGAGNTGSKLILQISDYPSYVESGYSPLPVSCGANTHPNNPLVGEVEGNFAVTPNGAATYQIPIKMSPGTAGIQPNLSLMYSSGMSSGIMGLGWSLSGLSAISRGNKNPYLDGKYEAISMGLNDVYNIDGNRLILKTGTYGTAGSTYDNEIATFDDITAIGSQGFGPQYFTIVDKNGTTSEYGNPANNAQLTGVGDNTPVAWLINKITDEFGNYMIFNYAHLNGEVVIANIQYTGNTTASLAPYNSIEFEYQPKTEKNTFYIGGIEFHNTQLLKSITAKNGNDLVKKYAFDYAYNFNTILNKVTEINQDGTEVNPTEFCWSDPYDNGTVQSSSHNTELYTNTSKYNTLKNTISADFNGDGFSDVLAIQTSNQFEVLENNYGTNFSNGSTGTKIGFTDHTTINTGGGPSNATFSSSFIFDENFDNKKEVYTIFETSGLIQDQQNNSSSSTMSYEILKTAYNGTEYVTTSIRSSNVNDIINGSYNSLPARVYYDKNDYTRDGIIDELIIDYDRVILNSTQGNVDMPLIGYFEPLVRPLDFDGDGSLEIIVFYANGSSSLLFDVYKYNAGAFNLIKTSNISISGSGGGDPLKLISMGDYNGDGKTDIAFLDHSKQILSIVYSTGTGYSAAKIISTFQGLTTSTNYNIISPDINGDGINDLIFTDNVTSTALQNYVAYLSVGDLFVKGFATQGHFNYTSYDVLKYEPIYGTYRAVTQTVNVPVSYQFSADLNGDGIYDVMSIDGAQTTIITNSLLGAKTLYLSSIYTALNKQIRLTYANTNTYFNNEHGIVYQERTSLAAYANPIVSYNPSRYVVSYSQFENTNVINLSSRFKYVYTGALFHTKGKGFLGFEEFITINRDTKISSIVSFTPNTTYFVPEHTSALSTVFDFNVTGGIYYPYYNYQNNISYQITDYQLTTLGGKKIFMAPSKVTQLNILSSAASVTEMSYDINKKGSLINSTNTYGWPNEPIIKFDQTDYTYQTVNGIIKPQSVTTSATQVGETDYTRIKTFTYDGAGHLNSTINDPSFGSQSLVSTYSNFNAFGSPTKSTLTAGDISPRISETLFDATGRFVIKTINPKSDVEEFVYEPKYGSLMQKKDISGLISTYTYDGLGRLIKTHLPDNTTNSVQYNWVTQPNTFSTYSKTILNQGEAYFTTFYNHLGQQSTTETIDYNGNKIVTENKYDYLLGLLTETTEPHFSNASSYLSTKYEYDTPYLRNTDTKVYKNVGISSTYQNIFSHTNYALKSVYYVPSGSTLYNPYFTETSDQTNKILRQEINAAGQLITTINSQVVTFPNIADPGQIQTSTYAFNSNGNPKTVILSYDASTNIPNVTHSFTYNNLGQQTQLIDPSAGTINYQYNTLGELLQQQEPTGTYDYTYDELGKVLTRTGTSSGLTNYQYVTANAGKNLIEKVIGQNATTEYTYDYLSRPITSKETVTSTGKVFTTATEYDTYSRISKQTHTGGYITKYSYSATGELLNIKDDANQTLWQLNAQNALGQITDYSYGNGINTTKVYDNLHQLTEINHGTIHKQVYNFDVLTANLKQRDFFKYATTANTHNREKFQFDGLDRLSQTKQTDPTNLDVQLYANNTAFDIKGNIIHKDDAGDFTYTNPSLPYSITGINNPTPLIPTNQLNTNINDLKKINQITESVTGKEMNFIYGNDDERLKVDYLINGIKQYTRYYQPNYDYQEDATATNTKEWTYLYAPTGLLAVYYKQNTTGQLLYALTDHLGSPIMLTNQAQQIQEEYSFDAWGRRRNPIDWMYTATAPNILNRGFTFHEHIDEFNLINMNGRVYDPALGRFIQPDNQVQYPDDIQTFNKYAYVFNNPLSYTDPSGWGGESGNQNWDGGIGLSPAYSNYGDVNSAGWASGGGGGGVWGGGGSWGVGSSLNNYTNWFSQSTSSIFSGKVTLNIPYIASWGRYRGNINWSSKAINLNFSTSYSSDFGIYSFGGDANVVNSSLFNGGLPSSLNSDVPSNTSVQGNGGGRNYGGDGSGSFTDNSMKVMDVLNQYNPFANLIDVLAYTFTGKDRLNNNMTLTEANLKAISIVPIFKFAGFASKTAKFGLGTTMWESNTFGPRSYLFGRYHSVYVPSGNRGILNTGMKIGIGWSSHMGQHVFRGKFIGIKLFDIYK